MKKLFLLSAVVLILPMVLLAQDAPVTPPPPPVVHPSTPLIVAPPKPPRQVLGPASESVDVLDENYQLTLTIADQDVPPVEVEVVVATSHFQMALGEPSLMFAGDFSVEKDGRVVVLYTLGWETRVGVGNNVGMRSSSTKGSVRVKLGEEVQIIRAGTRTAKLSVKKLGPGK